VTSGSIDEKLQVLPGVVDFDIMIANLWKNNCAFCTSIEAIRIPIIGIE
jgi:hypothetical protein